MVASPLRGGHALEAQDVIALTISPLKSPPIVAGTYPISELRCHKQRDIGRQESKSARGIFPSGIPSRCANVSAARLGHRTLEMAYLKTSWIFTA